MVSQACLAMKVGAAWGMFWMLAWLACWGLGFMGFGFSSGVRRERLIRPYHGMSLHWLPWDALLG